MILDLLAASKTRKRGRLKRIAVLTSGGDAPGMNAAIRAVVRSGIAQGLEVYGVMRGYAGLLEGQIERLVESSVANIIQRGGTMLKTSRSPEFMQARARARAAEHLARKRIDGLVVIGGDGSFRGAKALNEEHAIKVVGVPGTIDNDIPGTDTTIGFDTAVNTGIEAIDRIRDTASSHDRLFLVEVMGRRSGFIALHVGLGGGAESIIVPESHQNLSEICLPIERGAARGKKSSILVVAEGAKLGNATRLASLLKKRGYSSKVCILGHTQRGGSPTAYDRMLASALGSAAITTLLEGKTGVMVGVRHNTVVQVSFAHVFKETRRLPEKAMELVRVLSI